jgi:hypothetical protein
MTTISTDRLYATLVAGALAYVSAGSGVALGTSLSNRLFRQAAAKDAAYPYAVFSLRTPQLPDGDQGLKAVYQLEAFVYHRPRSAQAEAEGYADTLASYLRTLRDASNGLVYATDVVAESLPAFTSPADSSIVQVRITAKVHVWPSFISSLST